MIPERNRSLLQVAVIGLDRFGLAAAETLAKHGHEVLGVDRDEEAVHHAKDVVTHAVQAELYDMTLVRELGLHEVDAAIVAIGDDVESNIVSAALLLEAGVPYVVARANSPLHGIILGRVGVHRMVYPEVAAGEEVAQTVRAPEVTDFFELGPDVGIGKLEAPEGWVGRTLAELALSADDPTFIALVIQRGDETLANPDSGERVQAGDIVAILAQESRLDELPYLPRPRR